MNKLFTSLGIVLSMFYMVGTNAATISVSPSTQDVGLFGPDFTVDILGTGFPDYAPGGLGYGGLININWDPTVITLDNPVTDVLLGSSWSPSETYIYL